MIRILSIVLGTLVFIAVELTANPQATDGYIFEGKDFTQQNIRINMVYYESLDQLRLEATLRDYPNTDLMLAFAEADGKYCEIHTVDPNLEYRPERYGHELMHCVHGNWHSKQFVITYED